MLSRISSSIGSSSRVIAVTSTVVLVSLAFAGAGAVAATPFASFSGCLRRDAKVIYNIVFRRVRPAR